MRSAVVFDSGPPNAIMLPGSTPRATTFLTLSSWFWRSAFAASSSPPGTKYMYG